MEQMPNNSQNPEAEIMNIHQQIMGMGRNDSETSAINEIIRKLHVGEYSGDEAVMAARNLMDSKQDYN